MNGKWEPWKTYHKEQEPLPIAEPPCKYCEYWKPVNLFDAHGLVDGVRLCHAADMFRDFSCYLPKPFNFDDLRK